MDGLEEVEGACDFGGGGVGRPVEDGGDDGGQLFDVGAGRLAEQADEGAAEDDVVEVEDALVERDELDLAAGVAGQRGERRIYTRLRIGIAGLHIGVIAGAIISLLLLLRVPRRTALLAGLAVLALYVGVTGAGLPARRAFVMIAFFTA